MFRKIKENSILISGGLVFIAVAKQILYYKEFGIPIVDYLTFGEILTSIFDEVYFFAILLFMIVAYTIATTIGFELPKLVYKKYDSNKVREYLLDTDIDYRFFGIVLVAIGLMASMKLNYIPINNYTLFIVLLFVFQGVLVWFDFLHRNDEEKYIVEDKDSIYALLFSFCIYIFLTTHHDIQKLKSSNSDTTIITNTDTICCNRASQKTFLGKTENFCFIINSIDGTKQVIKMEDVKSIIYK